MRSILIILLFFTIWYSPESYSQIVISKPGLGFTQACASGSFNSYNVTFSFSPDTGLLPTNQFIIELSDESGGFTSPEVIHTTAAGSITSTPATINFSFPNTIGGEGYRIRIKSTAPAATSTPSNVFPAYFKFQDEPFTINNLISTGVYCAGGSYLLTIDNPGGPDNNTPLQYSGLTYNWYKETSETTFVFVASGESLDVNTPGKYFVETNYGTCTSNSYSNRVTVSESGSGGGATIGSSLGNPYCSGDGPTTLSAISGDSYKWFKDDVEIAGATSQMYQTNESGIYTCQINLGGCTETSTIDLSSSGFDSYINVPENNYVDDGQTINVIVTTDALSPEFKWYKDGAMISGAKTNTFDAFELGNYTVTVSQTQNCVASNEFNFNLLDAFPEVSKIPNLVSPNSDGYNDTWIIPQQYVDGTNTEVVIMDSRGKIVLQTNNYQNDWPANASDFSAFNPVYYYVITPQNQSSKKGSITIVK